MTDDFMFTPHKHKFHTRSATLSEYNKPRVPPIPTQHTDRCDYTPSGVTSSSSYGNTAAGRSSSGDAGEMLIKTHGLVEIETLSF